MNCLFFSFFFIITHRAQQPRSGWPSNIFRKFAHPSHNFHRGVKKCEIWRRSDDSQQNIQGSRSGHWKCQLKSIPNRTLLTSVTCEYCTVINDAVVFRHVTRPHYRNWCRPSRSLSRRCYCSRGLRDKAQDRSSSYRYILCVV